MMTRPYSIVVLIGVLLLGGIGGWWLAGNSFGVSPGAQEEGKITLPPDAEIFVPCLDGHGAHYSRPQDLIEGEKGWIGPSYVVDERPGEVIGIEYHVSTGAINAEQSSIEEALGRIISGEDLALLYEHKFPVFDVNYNAIDIIRISGHPGYEKDHYDVHAWILPPDQHETIVCPEA